MTLNDGYQLLLSASQMDIKMDFMPLIKISSLDLNQLSLTISPTKGNICVKLDSLIKLCKARIKFPHGEWNWLKKLKTGPVRCSSHFAIQYHLFQNVHSSLNIQSSKIPLLCIWYAVRIRYEQLLTNTIVSRGMALWK